MLSRNSGSRWRVVLLAAARLAGLYALGTALLLLPLLVGVGGLHQTLQDLKEVAIPIAFGFGIAFILLALARRAGLVALWLVLAAMWVWALRQSALVVGESLTPDLAMIFVVWSTLAIPLGVLGALGVPATFRIPLGPWRPTALSVIGVLWTALLIPALALLVLPAFDVHPLREAAVYRIGGTVAWFTWAPGALLISALSIAHVWVGIAPLKVEPAAA